MAQREYNDECNQTILAINLQFHSNAAELGG